MQRQAAIETVRTVSAVKRFSSGGIEVEGGGVRFRARDHRGPVTLSTLSRALPARLRTPTVWAITFWFWLLVGLEARAQPGGEARPDVVELAGPACAQTIDGFGTTAPPRHAGEGWLQDLYLGDLGASILRIDVTPRFRAPVSDRAYESPWFHGQPALPGPDGNNVRTYRGLGDYTRSFAGHRAAVAVLGPELTQETGRFDYSSAEARAIGSLAQRGVKLARAARAEFKLVGSLWSPAPWLKQTSGGSFQGSGDVMPKPGTPYPFVWAGNFAGGKLDTSSRPLPALADRSGPTSALTQFARITAAYVLGFQRAFSVRFYALSLQNELNFETFYNSCTYPDARCYVAALQALRRELDRYPELRAIQLIGPEDPLGADAYALWQFGDARAPVHKNLQYLATIARDPAAWKALSFVAVHAYANDGVHAAGDDDQMWRWWLDGWQKAPAAGLPERVRGVRSYGKKSWMTELSGEANVWAPAASGQLSDSALGLALKIHRGLTVGEQSAWLYWQLVDGKPVRGETLTDAALRERSPKYVAFKHFARTIRPGACVLPLKSDAKELAVSGYRHAVHGTTLVLINSGAARTVALDPVLVGKGMLTIYTSSAPSFWQTSRVRAGEPLSLPAQSIVSVVAQSGRK
jgi:O-glycosyl hydrolase